MGEPTDVDIDDFVRRHNNDIVATLNAAIDKHMYVSLQLLSDHGIVGQGNVCRYAPAFNSVAATLGGATIDDEVEKW